MDHEERPELVRPAQERAARKYGQAFTAGNTVLIGDTPNDVLAGHLGGARVIAVATGTYDAAALREAGAEPSSPTSATPRPSSAPSSRPHTDEHSDKRPLGSVK
ncbi:HAD hydrolase-like protein [Sphaerimonospora mesophila]|uniref:HAD hydrolase-like protein n=1 Tax=Sphaerimonospora mesophila TaxID=37483 RepID=UPI003D750FD4